MDREIKLNEREKFILRIFVKEYSKTLMPIGSKYLKERYNLGFSSATIRNIFSHLEELGFLFKPHTSAGRIPTDIGFRYYVDHLMDMNKIMTLELRNIEKYIQEKLIDLGYVMNIATQLISQFTNELAFTLGLNVESQKIEHIKLTLLSKKQALALIFLKSGIILNKVFFINEELINDKVIKIVEKVINDHSDEMFLSEIIDYVSNKVAQMEGELKKYQTVVDKILRKLQIIMTEFEEVHIEDVAGSNGKNIKELVVHNEIKELVTKYSGFDEAKIFIGKELNSQELIDYSMIISPFRIENDVAGILGIMGNKTMSYDFNIDFINKFSTIISNILTDKYRNGR